MRQFSTIVFGGLLLVFGGIAVAWAAGQIWQMLPAPHGDGTSTISLTRRITYTANEEEDLVNSAVESIHDNSGKITAAAYIVKDLTTGSVWTEYDSSRIMPIASLTKLITAVVARRLIPADDDVTITPSVMNTFGNTAGFMTNEFFTASQLLYPLLMVSSNDAAEALARAYGRPAFMKAMNDFVQSIGAYRTYFADPSGLSPQNVSSAGDIALITDWIRTHDQAILDITALKSKSLRNHTWVNPAHFLSWSYYVGGKNGYTDEADRTGVSLFKLGYNKDIYAIVVLGSDNRDADVIRLINKVK